MLSGGFGSSEKIFVEGAGVAFAASSGRDHDAVDVDELVVTRAEPDKIYVVIARGLIEGNEQSVGIGSGGGVKGFADELIELGERERG